MIKELWPDGPRFKEEPGVFSLGADSVLLADFFMKTGIKNRKRIVDLGCGSGIISVLLAWNDPGIHIDGIEIQPQAAQLALENAELSGLADRITIIEGDLRRHSEFLQSGAYGAVISNPPYYPFGSGKRAANTGLADARNDRSCALQDLCSAAGSLTRWGGAFFIVHKPERLAEIFRCLTAAGFEPKRIRFVQHAASSPPNLVLIESRKGGKPSLKIEAPLIMTSDDGGESGEIKAIYHMV